MWRKDQDPEFMAMEDRVRILFERHGIDFDEPVSDPPRRVFQIRKAMRS